MPTPRKIEMSAEEAAACDAVKALRLRLGMGQHQFARIVGTERRTICRWEHHVYVPQLRFLKRLKEIEKLYENLDTRDRLTDLCMVDKAPPKAKRLPQKDVNKLSVRLLGRILREVCGGRVRIPKPELHGTGIPKVQMKHDVVRNEIVAFVRREQRKRTV